VVGIRKKIIVENVLRSILIFRHIKYRQKYDGENVFLCVKNYFFIKGNDCYLFYYQASKVNITEPVIDKFSLSSLLSLPCDYL